MNKIILTGRLTRDPEFTTTQNGVSVVRFALAVQRKYANDAGERECDFINCVAWRGLAETINKYCRKGDKIGIAGEVQTRNYEAQDGTRRYVFEAVANELEFISNKQAGEEKSELAQQLVEVSDDDLPF